MQKTIEQVGHNNKKVEIPLRGVSNPWHQKPWEGGFEWFINVRGSQRSNYILICTVGCVLLFITHISFLTLLWMLYHFSDGSPILLIPLPSLLHLKYHELLPSGRQLHTGPSHCFPFSFHLRNQIQVSQPGFPELSTWKHTHTHTHTHPKNFGVNGL